MSAPLLERPAGTPVVEVTPRHRRARLGWSEGDAWTVGIGLVVSLVLAVTTVPAVLRAGEPRVATAAPLPAGPAAPSAPASGAPSPVPSAAAGPAPPDPGTPLPPPFVGPVAGPPAGPGAPAAGPVTEPGGAPALRPGEVRGLAVLGAGGGPGGVAVADGRLWVGTDAPGERAGPSRLVAVDARGRQLLSREVPGQPLDRSRGLTALAQHPQGGLLAVDAATQRLLRLAADSRTWTTAAVVPDVPACLLLLTGACQPGVTDTAPLLRGLAVASDGSAFVADAGQGVVWRLPAGGALEPWYASEDVAGPLGLAGLDVDADGHLLAVVTRLAGLQQSGAGALLRVAREADGSAGARTVVAAFAAGEDALDVAVGASGSAYVVLQGASAVVALDRRGTERLRVVDPALRGPVALDLGSGRLHVAVAQPTAVVEVGVTDRPL